MLSREIFHPKFDGLRRLDIQCGAEFRLELIEITIEEEERKKEEESLSIIDLKIIEAIR